MRRYQLLLAAVILLMSANPGVAGPEQIIGRAVPLVGQAVKSGAKTVLGGAVGGVAGTAASKTLFNDESSEPPALAPDPPAAPLGTVCVDSYYRIKGPMDTPYPVGEPCNVNARLLGAVEFPPGTVCVDSYYGIQVSMDVAYPVGTLCTLNVVLPGIVAP